jgi:hypothetical protein
MVEAGGALAILPKVLRSKLLERRALLGLLGIGATAATVRPAQSQSWDRSQLELLNDGPSQLAVLCPMIVYGGGTIAKGRISFQPKVTANWRLVISGFMPWFHVLDRDGAPVTPTRIWDDAHHTTTSGWLGVSFPPCKLADGDPTYLIARDPPGADNSVWIDAR